MTLGNRVLMFGYLNCKHYHWDANCITPNTSGRILNEFAESEGCIIHCSVDLTYVPFNGRTPSILDIAMTKDIPNVDNVMTLYTWK